MRTLEIWSFLIASAILLAAYQSGTWTMHQVRRPPARILEPAGW